jgi:hypothetical protein
MSKTILRPQQVDLLSVLDAEIAAGRRRLIAQAPTGFGKPRSLRSSPANIRTRAAG